MQLLAEYKAPRDRLRRLVRDADELALWSTDFFIGLIDQLTAQ